MKLSQRSYPHPVVGNGDDVPDAAFQVTYDYSSDKLNYYIATTILSSSTTLNRLISSGDAVFVLHVECSNTLYRKAFEFSETSKRIQIEASSLNDLVEVNAFILAKHAIPKYSVEGSHPDYENASFEIRATDVLAIAEGQTFIADTSHDSLRSISAIMQIEESSELGDVPMRADFNSDKIRIFLSKKDFESYLRLKNYLVLASNLTTTIVLPVLLEALRFIDGDTAASSYGSLRWYGNLKRRIQYLGLEAETDYLVKSQQLLEMPIRRALSSSEQYAEDMA